MRKEKIALRIDDVFASTKQFEVYGKEFILIRGKAFPVSIVSNFLFMKYTPGLRKRLPYREMNTAEWESMFKLLEENKARLTVGITAVWVEKNGKLIPFFEKFPWQAKTLKRGVKNGIIEIANHGYTHCVVEKHLPRLFASNRKFHREFWRWVPSDVHRQHIEMSQKLLSEYFNYSIITFAPPGNVWIEDTERFAFECGIRYLSSREELAPTGRKSNGLMYISDKDTICFHDREIALHGISWFQNLLFQNLDKELITVRELGESLMDVNDEEKILTDVKNER